MVAVTLNQFSKRTFSSAHTDIDVIGISWSACVALEFLRFMRYISDAGSSTVVELQSLRDYHFQDIIMYHL